MPSAAAAAAAGAATAAAATCPPPPAAALEPQTPPQLKPAPPHFLKYATCVLAPPTPGTSPLPEQPDTDHGPGSTLAQPHPQAGAVPAATGQGSQQEGARAWGAARAHVPGGRDRALRGAPAGWAAGTRRLAQLPRGLLSPPCVTGPLWRARKVRSGCGDVRGTEPPNLLGPGTESSRGGAFLGIRELLWC